MNSYRLIYKLRNADVNMYQYLRTSRLFEMIQEASITHTEQLGAGKEKTLDKGLLWVVTLQKCNIIRMPKYDETIILETYPGKTMHVLFPRYTKIKDAEGNVIISSSALWTLIDEKKRHFIFPEEYDISINGIQEDEIPLPSTLPSITQGEHISFHVPFSYVDLNRHMNNTHYFDLVDDISTNDPSIPACIETEYINELHWKDTVDIIYQKEKNQKAFMGMISTSIAFKIKIHY